MCLKIKSQLICFLSVVGRRPGKETQAASWRVLLHPDLPDRGRPEEDAAHRPQHVHPRRPGAHLRRQDTLQSGKLRNRTLAWVTHDVQHVLCVSTLCAYIQAYLMSLRF